MTNNRYKVLNIVLESRGYALEDLTGRARIVIKRDVYDLLFVLQIEVNKGEHSEWIAIKEAEYVGNDLEKSIAPLLERAKSYGLVLCGKEG